MNIYKSILAMTTVIAMLFVDENNISAEHIKTAQQIFKSTERAVAQVSSRRYHSARGLHDGSFDRSGSGFFVSSSGLLLTNAHVVRNEAEYGVKGPEFWKEESEEWTYEYIVRVDGVGDCEAQLVGLDHFRDLALLRVRIQSGTYTVLTWGDSRSVQEGDDCYAVGYPHGLGRSITSGVIGGLDRDTKMNYIERSLQIDPEIDHGNSGCPLLDAQGQVIGVCFAKWGNVKFAIPTHLVDLGSLMTGEVEIGYIDGVALKEVRIGQPSVDALLELRWDTGIIDVRMLVGIVNELIEHPVMVSEIKGALAGLFKRGDIIAKVNDRDIATLRDFRFAQAAVKRDAEVILEMHRVERDAEWNVVVIQYDVKLKLKFP